MIHTSHTEACAECWCKPCREFSTDGTRLGQQIAHTMGTASEEKILEISYRSTSRYVAESVLTGMPEEQADWDADE